MKLTLLVAAFASLLATGCSGSPNADAQQHAEGEVDLVKSGASPAPADSLARRADSLVRAGRPWRATVVLWPTLRTGERATPELRLAGARAAAAWEGWSEVQRLLRGQPWLDKSYGGEARELVARSTLELGGSAVDDARLALTDASDESSRVTREVILARAHDRAGTKDSAATHYLNAAARLPRVADWLRLRAAGVTSDSVARARLFARITLAAARARVGPTDAQARERNGDLESAATAYRKAGDEPSALRVESLMARDPSTKQALAGRIVAYLPRASVPEARQLLELFDKLGPVSVDQLALARALATSVPARAASAFAAAATANALAPADRMAQAAALGRANKPAEAARVYATLAADPKFAPLAAYQRARMQLQAGDGAGARAALRTVATQFAAVREASAPALLLLADLQVDDNDLAGAAASLHELTRSHAEAPQAPLARFRAGLLAWKSSPGSAWASFDSLAAMHPHDEETVAAKYWAARSLERAGRAADAKTRFEEIIRSSPLSYYAMRSAQRLNTPGWTPPTGDSALPRVAAIDSAVQRIAILDRLGMDVEMRFELDALTDRAAKNPAEASAIAQALSSAGEPARALRVALAAIEHGQATPALFRLAYPIVHPEALAAESQRNGLDAALVAGLIRQESSWNPRAASAANARGLMQLLPSVGAAIASSKQYPTWNTVLLYQPDVNIELGTAHLASSLTKDTPVERALAAYNAGGSRVARWINRPDSDDPELFTEWIPYTETRDYVRIVLRNAAIYRALYELK